MQPIDENETSAAPPVHDFSEADNDVGETKQEEDDDEPSAFSAAGPPPTPPPPVKFGSSSHRDTSGMSETSSTLRQRVTNSLLFRHKKQRSTHVDIATGRPTTRRQHVTLVQPTADEPASGLRSYWTRSAKSGRKQDLADMLRDSERDKDEQEQDEDDVEGGGSTPSTTTNKKHYRIESHLDARQRKRRWWSFLLDEETANRMLPNYLAWTFRTSFLTVAIVIYLQFLAIIIFFACFVYAVGRVQPQCISVAGADFDKAGEWRCVGARVRVGSDCWKWPCVCAILRLTRALFRPQLLRREGTDFMDAINLSWTTLSTVGYGIISPQVASAENRWYV